MTWTSSVRQILVTSILILFCFSSFGQAQIDSLKALLPTVSGTEKIDVQNKIARQLIYVSHTEAEQLIDEIITQSDALDYDEGKCFAQVLRGTLYMYQSRFSESKKNYLEAIAFAEEIGHTESLAYGKLGLGALYISKGEYALAYENHIEGVKFAREIENADLELTYLMNIGVINQLLQDFDEAEKFLKQALAIGEENNLIHRLGQIHGNLGIIQVNRKNYGLSIDHHKKAIGYFDQLNANTQKSISLQNIGFSYARLGEFVEAEKAYDESIELRLATGDSLGYARGLRYKGELFLDTDQLRKADRHLADALEITKKYNNEVLLSEIYELQFKSYEKQRDFRRALASHKDYMTIKDTLTAKANRNKIAQLTAEFEFDRLENENSLRIQENEIKDLKLRQRTQLIAGLALLMLAILAWGIWKRRQLRTKLVLQEKDFEIAQKEVQLRSTEFEAEKMRLVQYANQLLSKNQELEEKRELLEKKISSSIEERDEIDELIEKLRSTINEEKDWAAFKLYFDALFPDFNDKLKEEGAFELTLYEQRLIALIKISLSNKEIGGILNISRNSVVRAKHRLRQKFGFEDNKLFEDFIVNL